MNRAMSPVGSRRGMWICLGLMAFFAAGGVAWGWWILSSWPRRVRSLPVQDWEKALLNGLLEIARLETREEGSGRERARGLLSVLEPDRYPDGDFKFVAGTPARWEGCTGIEIGSASSGCWQTSADWLRLMATGTGARGVVVGGRSGAPGRHEFLAEETVLTGGEFLAAVRAIEVIAGTAPTRRPDREWTFDPEDTTRTGWLRVLGPSGVAFEDRGRTLGDGSPAFLRCDAARRVVSVLMRSREGHGLRPTPADREWLHGAFRDAAGGPSHPPQDRCSAILFDGIGDTEGRDMAIRRIHGYMR